MSSSTVENLNKEVEEMISLLQDRRKRLRNTDDDLLEEISELRKSQLLDSSVIEQIPVFSQFPLSQDSEVGYQRVVESQLPSSNLRDLVSQSTIAPQRTEVQVLNTVTEQINLEIILTRLMAMEELMKKQKPIDLVKKYSLEFWSSVEENDMSTVKIRSVKDSNIEVFNVDGIKFEVNKMDNNLTVWAEDSLFAWRVFHPEVAKAFGDLGGLLLKVASIATVVNDAIRSSTSTLEPEVGFHSFIDMASFENTHLLKMENNVFPVFNNLVEGKFSLDPFFLKEGGINLSARLNLLSMIGPPYPMNQEQVNSDFVVRVLLSWADIFQLMFGSEACLNCSLDHLISGSKIFEKILIKVRSSTLRLLPSNLILHKLADILFKWFSLVRSNFKYDNNSYSFYGRISAALLLKSFLDDFEILPLDNTIYEAQAAKGKNIQCFIGRQNSVNSFNSFQKDDSKKTSICLSHICKTFLNDHSDIFKCWMINDKCSRLHATKEEAKSYAQEVLSIIERSKNLLPGFKKEFIEKWNLFCESE